MDPCVQVNLFLCVSVSLCLLSPPLASVREEEVTDIFVFSFLPAQQFQWETKFLIVVDPEKFLKLALLGSTLFCTQP